MIVFLGTFFGAFLGCLSGCFFAIQANKEEKEVEEKREAPENISSLSDPMSLYKKYTDEKSELYKAIKPIRRKVKRIEVGTDEDTE